MASSGISIMNDEPGYQRCTDSPNDKLHVVFFSPRALLTIVNSSPLLRVSNC